MLTLYDYRPSQNAWKIRCLLHHLQRPFQTQCISIFEGAGQTAQYLRINPTGTVPAIRLDDGRVLSESNPILFHLAQGSRYLPDDAFAQAKVLQWLSFEQERVESQIGSLRYWTLTDKLPQRAPQMVEARRSAGRRALTMLDAELSMREFIAGQDYTIADIAMFAYASRAEEAALSLQPYPHFRQWLQRVEMQPGFLHDMHPYSVDPHASSELR